MNHWTLTYGADLDCRFWDEECLVHHALSNDTHRVAAWAGQLLTALDATRPVSTAELAAQFELTPDDAEEALESLRQLELVQRC